MKRKERKKERKKDEFPKRGRSVLVWHTALSGFVCVGPAGWSVGRSVLALAVPGSCVFIEDRTEASEDGRGRPLLPLPPLGIFVRPHRAVATGCLKGPGLWARHHHKVPRPLRHSIRQLFTSVALVSIHHQDPAQSSSCQIRVTLERASY